MGEELHRFFQPSVICYAVPFRPKSASDSAWITLVARAANSSCNSIAFTLSVVTGGCLHSILATHIGFSRLASERISTVTEIRRWAIPFPPFKSNTYLRSLKNLSCPLTIRHDDFSNGFRISILLCHKTVIYRYRVKPNSFRTYEVGFHFSSTQPTR